MEGKRLRARTFVAGDAINPAVNYHIEWDDRQQLLTEITDNSRWLLITGPWQSGKSSLMYALAESAELRGFHPVVTILSSQMVAAANDVSKNEIEAGNAFFELLANRLAARSRRALQRGSSTGMEGVSEMFLEPQQKEIIWFIDEASLLNDIKRVSIVQMLLSELRAVKQDCVSRRSQRGGTALVGGYYLRSFVLVGTPKLKQLIGDLRIQRLTDGCPTSSPAWDPSNPLGNSISPLSMERFKASDALSVEDIVTLLNEYRLEHDAEFRLREGPCTDGGAEAVAAIRKLSKSIWSITSGHKGMVCTCCELLVNNSLFTYTEWRRQLRLGHVSQYVFYAKAYSRVVSNITEYTESARQAVLECIQTAAPVSVESLYPLLQPLNDGVLEAVSENTVALASRLLLAAFLEDCCFAPLAEALPPVGTLEQAVQWAFPYISYDRISRDELLNANGQPAEYTWQCEFLLALKFILQHGYRRFKYVIMVEAKRKDASTRLDFLLKNQGSSPSMGFELQGAGNRASIKKHVAKAVGCGELHRCQMHYIYLQYGNCAGTDAKAIIKEEAEAVPHLNCWFVQYLPEAKQWKIEQLKRGDGGSRWSGVCRDEATTYPRFIFQKRRTVVD